MIAARIHCLNIAGWGNLPSPRLGLEHDQHAPFSSSRLLIRSNVGWLSRREFPRVERRENVTTLRPPHDYKSWLDFAVDCMDTRSLEQEDLWIDDPIKRHCQRAQPGGRWNWLQEMSFQGFDLPKIDLWLLFAFWLRSSRV